SSVDENGGEVEVKILDEQITIPVTFKQDLTVSKEEKTDATTVETGSSITTTYTATVTTKGTSDEDIDFTDSLSYVIKYSDDTPSATVTDANYSDYENVVSLTYGTATVTWYDEDGTQKETTTYTPSTDSLTFSLSLPGDLFSGKTEADLDSGDYFVISYPVTCAVANSATTVKSVAYSNTAEGGCTDDTTSDTTEMTITVTEPSDNFLTKSGTYNETDNTYAWTITINAEHENMAEKLGLTGTNGGVNIYDYLAYYDENKTLTSIYTTSPSAVGYVSAITFSLYDSYNQKQAEKTISQANLDATLSYSPGILLTYSNGSYRISGTLASYLNSWTWTDSSYSLVIEYEFNVSFFTLSEVENVTRSGYELFNYVKITKSNSTLFETEAELPGGPITVTKEGEQSEVSYNEDGTADISVLYSIKVSAPVGTSDSVQITDNGALAIDKSSIRVIYYTPDEVSTDGNSRKIAEYTLDELKTLGYTSTISSTNFTLNLPAMAPGTYYLVYYTAVYRNATLGQLYSGIGNGVNAEVLNNSTYRDSASCNLELIAYPFIEKTGVYNTKTGKIDWTITINEKRQDWRDYIDTGFLGFNPPTATYYIYLEDILSNLLRNNGESALYTDSITCDVTYTYNGNTTKTYNDRTLATLHELAKNHRFWVKRQYTK
ncbi:MAG: hypothetical protein LUG44_00960, partial [Clostridiales bacterium]|nr:hypothetical protein [Clostridiales bacterium]